MTLNALGLDDWFEQHAQQMRGPEQSIARVVAIDRGCLVLHDGQAEFTAELLGKFFYDAEAASNFPCVGDWVCVEHHDANNFASIHQVLPRKTLLKRKTVGYNEDIQMLASNIDVAFIVMSCHYDFNIAKLERFLVMIHEAQITPVLLFTKTDLISPQALEALRHSIVDAGIEIKVIALSNQTGEGLPQFRQFLEPRKTYCLLGSSGVGKSTLMNQLLGEEFFETQSVSNSGQGKHTTVRRHLLMLKEGAMLVDMPGMRELAISEVKEGIEDSFSDIVAFAAQCRFANCTHESEPHCAIQKALASKEIKAEHYKNYLKIKQESQHHQKTSFIEKRKKAKNASRKAPTKTQQRKDRKQRVFDMDEE